MYHPPASTGLGPKISMRTGGRVVRPVSEFTRGELVKSALYEAVLRDVGRYEELARRAEGFADDELAEFFRGIRDENQRRAEEARRLLAQRVAE